MSRAGEGACVKLIVSPEPAAWLAPLLDSLGGDDVTVIAPWSVPGHAPDFLPARLRTAWNRRSLDVRSRIGIPGWGVVESLWRRVGSTGPLMSKLALRQALDALVSLWIPKSVTHVFAPSLCALRTFAKTNAEKVLLEDLPGLRQLHADLDVAHRALPSCAILHNFRAPDPAVIRQEQEAVLANRVLAQGHFARARLLRQGVAREKAGALPSPRIDAPFNFDPDARAVCFAGTTAVRAGLEVALAAIDQVPGITIYARRAEGSFGPSLAHPRLRLLSGPQNFVAPVLPERSRGAVWLSHAPLDFARGERGGQVSQQHAEHPVPTVRGVLAPAWVECRSPEVEAAARAEIPLLATRRALGWVEPSRLVTEINPGNVQAIIRWLRSLQKNIPPRRDASAS